MIPREHADRLTDLAAQSLERGDLATADRLLEALLAEKRPSVASLFNAGLLRSRQGRREDAIARFRETVRRDPDHVKARFNLALALADAGDFDEAAKACTLLLSRKPRDPAALLLLATLRGRQSRFAEALDLTERAARAGADTTAMISTLALGFAHACDWAPRDALRARMRTALARDPAPNDGVMDAFAILSHEDDPALQRRAGAALAQLVRARVGPAPVLPPPRAASGRRIHVAYLSCDFHHHATSELFAGVLEHHDRDRFLVSAYSFGIAQDTPMRRRVAAAPERFVELFLEPPAASVARIRADAVDILVDLKGYTEGARPEIGALRAAPIQVSHLGYPGSMGADWIDYMIGDPVVLPLSEQPHWSERIVQLPDTYQPNDDQRPRPEPDTDRAAHGLPADAIVFACFNNSYKITPDRFAIWLDLLRGVSGSVLWLLNVNPLVEANLHKQARASGIDPGRLVFSGILDQEAHLARHGCADIFLDNAPYGAHTTASNALWMGVPVVTLPGRCFASRVAASLVSACGLPELIARDEAEYAAIARALAQDPARRARIRDHLIGQRTALKLFDTRSHTRALEAAYTAMVDRAAAGRGPAPLVIGRDHSPAFVD